MPASAVFALFAIYPTQASLIRSARRSLHLEVPVNDTQPAVVDHTHDQRWWGYKHVPDHEDPLRSWAEFERDHGNLGKACSAQMSHQQCGVTYTCTHGSCVPCSLSRDCMEEYRCEFDVMEGHNLCIPRDLISQWHWREAVCTVLIVLTAMLSAAAGMGGGGVYVPLCLLLLGLSTKEAIPLSQAMILGGAVINIVMFAGDRHPQYHHRPKVDYDVIMMLNPGLAAGVTLGVICHMISPQWITVLVLNVTLIITLQKSLTKGISSWQKESKALAAAAARGGASPPQAQAIGIKMPDLKAFLQLVPDNARPMGLILGCWLVFLVMNVLKAPQCSTMYWMQILGMMLICLAFTWAGAQHIRSKMGNGDKPVEEGILEWTAQTLWQYPAMTTVAGFLGGFLGIGGGIVLGPLLLELGMHAEASQATTAMFVFLSSSLATLQFVVLGKGMPQYVIWFTSWVVLATLVGQTGIDYLLKKYQRTSPIVLSVAGIVAGSLIMMTLVGGIDIYTDFMRGAPMGFHPSHLCTGH